MSTPEPQHLPDHVNVAVLGGGSAGEQVAQTVAAGGRSVALIEEHLVGGECPFFACIPSKSMLRTAALRHQLGMADDIGASAQPIDPGDGAEAFRTAARRRDEAADHHDDQEHVESMQDAGVVVVRGTGHIDRPGRLTITGEEGDRALSFDHLVLATGATVAVPPIEGLEDVDHWTFVDAWTATVRPASMLVLGGGPVGIEIAQVYATFGSAVTLVETSEELLGGQAEPEVAADLAQLLQTSGVDVRTGVGPDRITRTDDGLVVEMGGTTLSVDVVVVATGKSPNTHGLGLEALGIDPDDLRVDDHCRVDGAEDVWAVGDVTDMAPFTHTANHQGTVAAANILGGDSTAHYRAIPRTVYTSPEVASVGQTRAMAEEDGVDVVSIAFDLADTARAGVDHESAGRLVLVADRASRVLIGASLVAPSAGESISEFSLAIHTRTTVDVLAEVIHPFPTWSEGFGPAIQQLLDVLD